MIYFKKAFARRSNIRCFALVYFQIYFLFTKKFLFCEWKLIFVLWKKLSYLIKFI